MLINNGMFSNLLKHINAYKKFNLLFVEEPTSPDDVLGFVKIKKEVGDVKTCDRRSLWWSNNV